MKKEHGCQYEKVCADTGYESLTTIFIWKKMDR